MKQGGGHLLLGELAGPCEESCSQNNKRQRWEAYVRRNTDLLLLSFQLKRKKKEKEPVICCTSSPGISDHGTAELGVFPAKAAPSCWIGLGCLGGRGKDQPSLCHKFRLISGCSKNHHH